MRRVVALIAIVAVLSAVMPLAAGQANDPGELIRDTALSEGRGLNPTSEIIADIWVKVIWVSSAIFLLVMLVLVYALVRWRRRPGEKREVPQIHGNSKLEIAWTIGPALVMIWLLVISYNGLMAIDYPTEEPEIYIGVVGRQFLWEFHYPDGTESAGQDAVLRLEAGRWVQLNVTSGDVIHAISIPSLSVMIDANPGRVNEVVFYTGHETGLHLVQCRQFCGAAGHGVMLAAAEIFPAGSQPVPYGAPPPPPAAPIVAPDPEQNETAPPPAEADRRIEVGMHEFRFDPAPVAVEPGETIEILAANRGGTVHNLYIGTYDHGARRGEPFCTPENECWQTRASIPPGQSDTFVFTAPDEPIAFDLWCDVPGHVAEGMLTFLSVGGAEPAEEIPMPRLPGPGLVLVLAALAGFVLVVRRRGKQQD